MSHIGSNGGSSGDSNGGSNSGSSGGQQWTDGSSIDRSKAGDGSSRGQSQDWLLCCRLAC